MGQFSFFLLLKIKEPEIRQDKTTRHCNSNRTGIGAWAVSVTAVKVVWEGILHVSYCNMGPWRAVQLLLGPLLGSGQC